MNDIEKAIEALKMENELIQFDPMTGESQLPPFIETEACKSLS